MAKFEAPQSETSPDAGVPSSRSEAEPSAPSSSAGARLFNRVLLALLLVLAPLKFGLVTGTMEISAFPLLPFEWLLSTWPPWLFPPLAGVALLVSMASIRGPARFGWSMAVPGVWLLLLVGALPGLLRTTEWDIAQQFLWHLTGACCAALAAYRTVSLDRQARVWLLGAVVTGACLASLQAWNQVVFGGYEQTLETAREHGIALAAPVVERLREGRASGPFVYPNSLAAHMVLVVPLALLAVWRAGRWFEPTRWSRPLFAGFGAVLLGGALVLSGSRAGVASLVAAVLGTAVLSRGLGRWRLAVAVALLVCGLALAAIVNRGRGLSSLEARGEYYKACVAMVAGHPLTGVGLGEFFPWYTRLKPIEAEDTRRPHNLVLGFAAQAGVLGGAAAVLCLSLPLWFRGAFRTDGWHIDPALGGAVFAGLSAWFLHSLLDFNVHIPGTLATVAALPFLCVDRTPNSASRPGGNGALPGAVACALALVAVVGLWRWPGERAYAQLLAAGPPGTSSSAEWDRLVERACRRLPLSPYPCWVGAKAALARGQSGPALGLLRETVRRAPHRAVFLDALATELARNGEVEAARRVQRRADRWKP